MSLRYPHFKKISCLSSRILPGNPCRQSTKLANLSDTSSVPLSDLEKNLSSRFFLGGCLSCRFSTSPQVSQASRPRVNMISFIKSAMGELQGPSPYWLNRDEGISDFFKKEGTYLVIAGKLLDSSQAAGCDPNVIFEKVKLLQQRFPQIYFMGLHSSNRACFPEDQHKLAQLVMKEYLTFPILLSDKEFPEPAGDLCYMVFRDFKNPVIYHEKSLDVRELSKALEEFLAQDNGKPKPVEIFTNTWSKQAEAFKESHLCSPLQNLLLCFPGCVSADEDGNRLFLSDCNHHRIIIFDGSGKILDSIGYSPGFEDGEFESARLSRPAASFYDADEDCLYIVDSENHAIRRADLERRVLETVYPYCTDKKNTGLWNWIKEKLGFGADIDTTSDVDKSVDISDPDTLMFPWHILKSDDDSFLVMNRSFQKLWVMDLAAGEKKETVEGFPKILEVCGQLITEKVSLLNRMPPDWLQQQTEVGYSPKELPNVVLLSSFTTFGDDIIMSDLVGQRVLKLSRESGACSNIQFSNLGILGLPYWLTPPLERAYSVANGVREAYCDHIQHFRLLPGKVVIRVNIEIPACAELVEPLQEGCIWRQARGTTTEISGAENSKESSEKVGVAQQWYDELDNLAFETPEPEMIGEEEDDDKPSDIKSEDNRIHINCAVNTSPGTSEVIIYAALYLKLGRNSGSEESDREECAEKIADILKPDKTRGINRDVFIKFVLNSNRDLKDLIFIKPLHIRIKLDSLDHPKADNSKDIILTDSLVEVNVSV